MRFFQTFLSALLIFSLQFSARSQTQSWQPITQGFASDQPGIHGQTYHIDFYPNGPLDRDWIYGTWLDENNLRRCIAYRQGGRWVPIPFHGSVNMLNRVNDMAMYGDTLYVAGSFGDPTLDKDSSALPPAGLLKIFEDSLWVDSHINLANSITVKGDTLLIAGASYYNPPDIIYHQFMTTDGGSTWQYPYTVVHPTENTPRFGAHAQLEILENGDILTINNGSPRGNKFSGITRWDGKKWHSYGQGLFGTYARVFNFQFYKDVLYIGGTFSKAEDISNPGNFIARWSGNRWENFANGLKGFVKNQFVYDSTLYANIDGGSEMQHRFGDAQIPFFAGWNGQQWCGTPIFYDSLPPASFGFIKDTLYATFYEPGIVQGDSVFFLNYFDGDYLNGPNAICSSIGLNEPELEAKQARFEIYPMPSRQEVKIAATRSESTLSLTGLRPGVYLLQVNGQSYQKFIKE